ncbi:PcfJ domain-containing protein [Paenibacillus polymyxa]|uniref:PcfJ domain-containing protein n=1 Tax=Paenibacillus polymyxa TaxID=1406 RepID=UPI0020243721|nr:PcfJ domain-containing protein [Paenibacillus polymyxa]URJ36577.3 PcfJ domain-containing protein [Paenibacillus polymyxa]
MTTLTYDEFITHFPTKISKSLVKYVRDTVLKNSRYLFIKTMLGVQAAYCTHCNKQHHPETKLKHKQKERVVCPHCKSLCEVRAAGISRKYMSDQAVLVWYEKSVRDRQAITARIIEVRRNYCGDYKNVETVYHVGHMYLFEPGRGTFYTYRRERPKTVYSAFDRYYSGSIWPKFMSQKNINHAVKGTPFQYSTWEHYTRFKNQRYVSDMVEFFDLAARYPCVEYLTKAGFENFIWAKLYKYKTYGAINWRGKTLQKVLRLSKTELKELKSSGLKFKAGHLRYYQIARSKGLSVSLPEAYVLADVHGGMSETYYKVALTFAPEAVVIKYLLKQLKKGHYEKVYDVLSDWRDYRGQCEKLRMSLKEERYLFPNDLHEAHMKLTKRIKLKEDAAVNKMIAARLPKLQNFCFEWKGLLIRPAASSIDLFEEGKALQHCVGDYAESYGKGESDIFFIRRIDQPNKPYYTMEIQKGKVVQCRCFKNKGMTPEVRAFVDQFISKKLLTKKRTRIDITGIEQGAAV